MPAVTPGQKAAYEFRNQVALGLVADKSFEDDAVRAAIGMENCLSTVAIGVGEVGRARRLCDAVVQVAANHVHPFDGNAAAPELARKIIAEIRKARGESRSQK